MKKAILSPVIFFIIFCASAQPVDSALALLSARQPAEKIYIHYDKEYYVVGETIWFKAYLYHDGRPDELSNNLLLQLLDNSGRLVSARTFPVQGAVARGHIDLPDSLPQDQYFIRAFTPGMINFDEGLIYKKPFYVFRPGQTAAASKQSAPELSIHFFPESGDMVDGILSVLGFKATDQWGRPIEVTGVIRTEDGATIASFFSTHDGIGRVQFRPKAGKTYFAEAESPAAGVTTKKVVPLPEVKTSGINLHIQDEEGGKKFQLSRSEKDQALYARVWLVAQINNHIVYENEISFEDYPSVIGHLLTDSLPSGILHFTVFNEDWAPLAERLSFVNNREYLGKVDVAPVQLNLTKRAANSIELSFPEEIQRTCSVAVTDASGGAGDDDENIWSRLLLTSDLKGKIYDPAWYFINPPDSVSQAMDNLMLTHGWSRFNWTRILAGDIPVSKMTDQPYLSVEGRVTDEKGTAMSNGAVNIYLETADSVTQNLDAAVQADGSFRLDSLLFFGRAKFFYAYLDGKGKQRPALVSLKESPLTVYMNQLPAKPEIPPMLPPVGYDRLSSEVNTRYGYIRSRLEEIKELEKVSLQSKPEKKNYEEVNNKYTTGVFRTPAKVTLDNINEPVNDKSLGAIDFIKNRVQQVELQGTQFVNRKTFSLGSGRKWAVGIFLNEAPTDIFQLRLLRAEDIALVKFFDAGFVGVGSSFPGGAISVYTKEEANMPGRPDKLNSVGYNGYSIIKEFYTPDYNNPDSHKPQADNRTTVYWNPDVFTDTGTRSVKLQFFNNDFSRRLRVVVEGFDAEGKLIHAEKIIGSD